MYSQGFSVFSFFATTYKGGLISESFFFNFGSNLPKNMPNHCLIELPNQKMLRVVLAHFLGDWSKREKLFEIKPPLARAQKYTSHPFSSCEVFFFATSRLQLKVAGLISKRCSLCKMTENRPRHPNMNRVLEKYFPKTSFVLSVILGDPTQFFFFATSIAT